MERRSVLKWMVRGMGLITAGLVGGPAAATLFSPVFRERRGPSWQSLGPASQFEPGRMHKAVVPSSDTAGMSQGVFVWAESGHEFVVFSRACTDLACPVQWDSGSGWFFCPCHGGIFNREGEPKAGPPAYPLYRFQTRVRQGMLEIDLHSVPPIT